MFPSNGEDRLGQFVITLGAQTRRVDTVLPERDCLAWLLVGHAFSSTKRCSILVPGPCCGVPCLPPRSPTPTPAPCRRPRRRASSVAPHRALALHPAHTRLARGPPHNM